MAPSSNRSVWIFQLALVIGFSLFLISRGVFPTPELLLLLVIVLFGVQPDSRRFVIDFAPFAMLLIGYSALRGFADDVAPGQINVENVIAWERFLFQGDIPAVILQQMLRDQPYTPALNWITSALYMSHFVVPLLVGAIFWFQKRSYYWAFMVGLLLLSFLAYITYVLFPVAPPWWASQYGRLSGDTVALTNFIFPSLVVVLSPNPVAAMPSLHMAYPTYIALCCCAIWGWRAIWIWVYPLLLAFTTVYLGHHYVVDLIGGLIYAGASFAVVWFWLWRGNKL